MALKIHILLYGNPKDHENQTDFDIPRVHVLRGQITGSCMYAAA